VVGIGTADNDLPAQLYKLIEEAQVLVGGTRFIDRFGHHGVEKITFKDGLENVFEKIALKRTAGKSVVVLADGDPLFFGIGKSLVDYFGRDNIKIYPCLTTLQAAASRIKLPWENVLTLSLHGRNDLWPLWQALSLHERVAIYTDSRFNPAEIARKLKQRQIDAFKMIVFENLGLETEKISLLEIHEALQMSFGPLNFVLLERKNSPEIPLRIGLDDDLYIHEAGLITKKEIRLISLGCLQIDPGSVVWDLGAGCGSIAIEAACLTRKGQVLAVEKKESRLRIIRDNIKRTGAYVVEPVLGRMPACLESLPDPDRVFIGGGLGRGVEVLQAATDRLKSGGRIVVNVVLLGSFEKTRAHFNALNWPFSVVQAQVCRSKEIAGDQRMEALNPVFIFSATRPPATK
jgi:precorrin-6Y C5,15-methyltransferase (decarboxylating)